jgi:hypothetical protein
MGNLVELFLCDVGVAYLQRLSRASSAPYRALATLEDPGVLGLATRRYANYLRIAWRCRAWSHATEDALVDVNK